jgi:hypothetical protein
MDIQHTQGMVVLQIRRDERSDQTGTADEEEVHKNGDLVIRGFGDLVI